MRQIIRIGVQTAHNLYRKLVYFDLYDLVPMEILFWIGVECCLCFLPKPFCFPNFPPSIPPFFPLGQFYFAHQGTVFFFLCQCKQNPDVKGCMVSVKL